MKNIFIFLSCVLLIHAVVSGESYDRLIKQYKKEINKKSSELIKKEKELQEKKAEQDKYKKEEQQVRNELTRIRRELGNLSAEITKIQSKIRSTMKNIRQSEAEIKSARTEKSQWQDIMRKELAMFYRRYRTSAVLTDVPWEKKYFSYAIKAKTQIVNNADIRRASAEASYMRYELLKDELLVLKDRHTAKQREYKNLQTAKAELLKSATGRRVAAEEEVKALRETAGELKALLRSLEEKKTQTIEMKKQEEFAKKHFAEKKKLLPWPVSGEVIMHFGKNKHPKLDTYEICNGIKIRTASNQQVSAVDAGEVVYAREFRSYGRTIIIDHRGDTYTIYGHLGEFLVEEGAKVSAGQTIGKPGSDNGYLYFELRIDDQPQDPIAWLKEEKK
ncbi:MAG: peptidoglycan DD-metalloendopeptidase family protein [Elusimicrobia bacterium]|nr:peptidoglycan DD-metalloendopeptidase family protein [Elusimicrobiota bacterium]